MRKALLEALYEYFLVTVPVGLYVTLEAVHKENLEHLILSPEWAIATIFLAFQSLSLYIRGMRESRAKFSPASMGLLALGGVLVIAFAAINANQSLLHESALLVRFRIGLFLVSSVFFVLFVGGAFFVADRSMRNGA